MLSRFQGFTQKSCGFKVLLRRAVVSRFYTAELWFQGFKVFTELFAPRG